MEEGADADAATPRVTQTTTVTFMGETVSMRRNDILALARALAPVPSLVYMGPVYMVSCCLHQFISLVLTS